MKKTRQFNPLTSLWFLGALFATWLNIVYTTAARFGPWWALLYMWPPVYVGWRMGTEVFYRVDRLAHKPIGVELHLRTGDKLLAKLDYVGYFGGTHLWEVRHVPAETVRITVAVMPAHCEIAAGWDAAPHYE